MTASRWCVFLSFALTLCICAAAPAQDAAERDVAKLRAFDMQFWGDLVMNLMRAGEEKTGPAEIRDLPKQAEGAVVRYSSAIWQTLYRAGDLMQRENVEKWQALGPVAPGAVLEALLEDSVSVPLARAFGEFCELTAAGQKVQVRESTGVSMPLWMTPIFIVKPKDLADPFADTVQVSCSALPAVGPDQPLAWELSVVGEPSQAILAGCAEMRREVADCRARVRKHLLPMGTAAQLRPLEARIDQVEAELGSGPRRTIGGEQKLGVLLARVILHHAEVGGQPRITQIVIDYCWPLMGIVENNSRQATLTAHLTVINVALQLARNDTGQTKAVYTLDELASEKAPRGAKEWHGPYLAAIPKHPYGGQYKYDPKTDRYVSDIPVQPTSSRAEEDRPPQAVCWSNMSRLAAAFILYADDHGYRLPREDNWLAPILPYLLDSKLLRCPSDPAPVRGLSYFFNAQLSGRSLTEFERPQELMLLAEGLAGSGGPERLVARHDGWVNVAYVDGHAQRLTLEQAKRPELWKPH